MKNPWAILGTQFVLIAVLLSGTAKAQNQFTVGAFTVNFLGVGQQYDTGRMTTDALNDSAERDAVLRAVQYWADVLGYDTTIHIGGGGSVVINVGYYIGPTGNLAGSNSAIVTSLGIGPGTIPGTAITNPQAILTSDGANTSTKIDGVNGADCYVMFNVNATYSPSRNTQFDTSEPGKFSLEAVMLHEMAHTLGIIRLDGTSGSGLVTFGEEWGELSFFENHFLIGNTIPVAVGDTYPWSVINSGGVTFSGTNVANVYGDNWVSGGTSNVTLFTDSPGYQRGSTLAHPETDYGRLNANDDGTLRPFLSEAELALMSDLGYYYLETDPNYLHFGRSLYQSHPGTIENNTAFESWAMDGVGLHLVAGGNSVVQTADLISHGYAGTGIRIENDGNKVTIARYVSVVGTGEEGVGVLVTDGSGTVLINRGLIGAADGTGRAVWFNANTEKFDSSGKIVTYDDAAIAIDISAGVTVGKINIMDEYKDGPEFIFGDIINNGNPTTLTFGKMPDANGEATDSGDANFVLSLRDNDITGTGVFDLETWGGSTWLGGDTLDRFRNGLVKAGSMLDLEGNGTVLFSGNMTVENGGALTGYDQNRSLSIGGQLANNGSVTKFNELTLGTTLTNNGTVSDTKILEVGGSVINQAGARIGDIGTMTVGTMLLGTRLDNAGLIENVTLVDVKANIINSGTLRIIDTLQAGGNLSNTASGRIENFKTLAVGGNLSNAGFINVASSAAMNIVGTGTNTGRLTVNGNAAFGGTFNNNSGGRVDGSGQMTATNVINAGTISPGNPEALNTIGTLSINGNFTNNAAGHFAIQINPSHTGDPVAGVHNDLIKVNGNATINGGVIDIIAPTNDPWVHPDPARYVAGTKYTFLDATGGLTVNSPFRIGSTSEVLLFDFLINQSANPLSLEVPPEVVIERDYIYGRYGNTLNQRTIGYYIDDIGRNPNPLGDFFTVLVGLDKLNSDAGIPHRTGISQAARFAEEQMSGMIYGTLAQSSITNTTIVNNTLHDVLRRDTLRFNELPFARNLWAIGHGVGGHTYFDGNARGYGQQFGGAVIGCDYFNRWLGRTGGYISYGGGQIYSNLADKSKSKELQAGLYLRKETPLGYFLVSGGLGYNDYNTSRTISFMNRRTQNYHNAFVGTAYGEFGREFQRSCVKFQPFAGLQYVGNQQHSFTERGANSLNLVGDITTGNSLRSLIGSRLSTELRCVRQGSLSLSGQLVWMHELLDRTSTDFTAQFSNPGMTYFRSTAKYTVRGNSPGRDWGIVGGGLNYDIGRWRFFGGYDAYLNSHQLLHAGNAGFMFGW